MMRLLIFAILSVIVNGLNGNSTDNSTVTKFNVSPFNDTKTESGILYKKILLTCPNVLNDSNFNSIVWYYDQTNNQSDKLNVTNRITNLSNGSLLIENLQYGDSKIYVCKGNVSNVSITININLTVYGPPMNFSEFYSESLSDSLIVFWRINISKNNKIDKYNVTLCKSFKECQTWSVNNTMNSFTFTKLKPFHDYNVSIIAFNDAGTNEMAHIKAKTKSGALTARVSLSTKTINSRNVTLLVECQDCNDTDKISGQMKSFIIKYNGRSVYETVNVTYNNTPVTETTIVNLYPFTLYNLVVVASNGVAVGPAYNSSFVTKEEIPKSTVYIYGRRVTPNNISLQWDQASDDYGPITGYILKLNDMSNRTVNETIVNLNRHTLRHIFKNLKPKNRYTISLAAKNQMGISDFVKVTLVTDRAAPLEPIINKVEIVSNVINVEWKNLLPLNEPARVSYDICWKPSVDPDMGQKCIVTSDRDNTIKCSCNPNSTIHSVHIPVNEINYNYQKIAFSVRVKIQNDFCWNDHDNCRVLDAISKEYTMDVYDTKSILRNAIIISIIAGFIILFAGLFVLFFFCGNKNLKGLFSSRQRSNYMRPPGEFIEVFPRQISQPKILPLEKTPHVPIQVKDLIDHIMTYRCDDGAGFQTEFEALELIDTSKWGTIAANFKENKAKNRYTNIFPYDHSRVLLQNAANSRSDYINASFIDGYNRPNAYIATQGPLPETICDFWQMIYEQNSEIIVMISNFDERGRRKCEVYWVPNKVAFYGNISVRQIYQKKMAFYTERRFAIKNIRNRKHTNKERTVYHYQYTDWRDFDVPPSSLPVLVFVKATTKHWSMNSGPIIVHCSAGVGRTGTYICIESQIRQMKEELRINVRGFLEHIRQQRMKLVQTESQYTFIHDALYEYYLCPDHEIHKDNFSGHIFQLKAADSIGFLKQFQVCTQFEPTNYEYIECKRSYNVPKNRSKILPIESRRINLSCEPGIEGSNYINASAIQGYWEMKQYIITQHPLDITEPDFWKMVWDENCNIIILLSNEDLPQFWPSSVDDFRSYLWSRVNYSNYEETENMSTHSFLLSSPREDYALDCTMYRLKQWPTNIGDTADLLHLLFKVNADHNHAPIVVVDDDGGSRAGLFVALCSLLNQLRHDDVVDVYFVMKLIHMERPHIFNSSDDLKFLYELLEHIIANQNSYSFFSSPPTTMDFIPNGVCHQNVVTSRSSVNNNDPYTNQCATLNNTLPSKSSSSVSRRRASSAESEPFCVSSSNNQSPVKTRSIYNRISWNPGETARYSMLSDSLIDWSSSSAAMANGHYNGVQQAQQSQQPMGIIANPITVNDLPVAQILSAVCLGDNDVTVSSEV